MVKLGYTRLTKLLVSNTINISNFTVFSYSTQKKQRAYDQWFNIHIERIMFTSAIYMYHGPFYIYGLSLFPAWISNHTTSEVGDDMSYQNQNVNGCTDEVWELISNFIPYLITNVIIRPRWDQT